MALIVQKYGGTSVGTVEKIKNVAKRVARTKDQGNDVVVVVSAMSGETNRLLGLAHQISELPNERELDVVASTGEQVTIGLLAIALIEMGYKSKSFCGFQIPVLTDSAYVKARIRKIEGETIQAALKDGEIAVVAGFHGLDDSGAITTLGRGGSDTSAVAVAAALKADVCEIYTDVDGVYTTDPNICSDARKLEKISFEEMLELASLGAKVLQIRSVEFGMKYGVRIHVRSSFNDNPGTLVTKEEEIMETARARAAPARARRRGAALHRAAARPRRAGGPRAPRPDAHHPDLSRRNAAERVGGAAGDGPGRAEGLEHQGAPRRRADGGVPYLPHRRAIRRRALGGDDARIGYRLASGAGGRRAAALRLSLRPRALDALVRPQRGRHQAVDGKGRPHGGARRVVRPAAGPRPVRRRHAATPVTADYPRARARWYVVGVLTLAYVFAYADRVILNLLVVPIRRDLGISDTQMSLLMGFGFVVFFTFFGILLGRVVDTRSRRALIAAGMVVWSLLTAGCGLARRFWHFLLLRMGVGVGEATLNPAAYSLIADYFPPDARATALGVYGTGIYLGSGLAFIGGGLVVGWASARDALVFPVVGAVRPWQAIFFLVGLGGALAAALLATVREP